MDSPWGLYSTWESIVVDLGTNVNAMYPLTGINFCANNTCSHLCLLTSNNYTCHCSVGTRLKDDGRSCAGE